MAEERPVDVDVERYLRRISHCGSTAPTAETLAALQLAHMIAVPFENLHVVHGASMRTDLEWSYPKIVEHRRGGWCFELNLDPPMETWCRGCGERCGFGVAEPFDLGVRAWRSSRRAVSGCQRWRM